jgi:hypothetical protein
MKEFKVFSEENKHEYDIFVEDTDDGTKYSLYYSSASHWTYPGEAVLECVDTGNEIKFSEKFSKTFDYSTFGDVLILLNFIRVFDKNLMFKYRAIPADETVYDL